MMKRNIAINAIAQKMLEKFGFKNYPRFSWHKRFVNLLYIDKLFIFFVFRLNYVAFLFEIQV